MTSLVCNFTYGQYNANCTSKLDSFFNLGYVCAFCVKVDNNKDSVYLGTKVKSFYLNNKDTLTTLENYLTSRNNWLNTKNNEGFLTANSRLVVVAQTNSAIYMESALDYGPKWELDSVCSLNNIGIDPKLIKRVGGLRYNFIWTPNLINQISIKMAAISGFSSEGSNIRLKILDDRKIITLPVVLQTQNYLSGIIGANTSENGRSRITGEIEGSFLNMFNKGYALFFKWESFRQSSQQFKINMQLPYILGIPFLIEPSFEFQKFDSIYTNATIKTNLIFPLSKKIRLQAGIESTNNTRISLDEKRILLTKQLPLNPSFKSVLYNLGIKTSWGNNQFFSKKLFQCFLQAQVGSRTFIKDAKIANLTWKNYKGEVVNIYDSIKNLKTLKYQLQFAAEWRFKIGNMFVLKNKVIAEVLYLPTLFFNELKRYGGINSLIGFNEQSIFANKFYSYQTELRMQIATNGYVGIMLNTALTNNDWKSAVLKETVFLGGGITGALQTKAGILQLAWALGSINRQSININQSRFHFGLVTAISSP